MPRTSAAISNDIDLLLSGAASSDLFSSKSEAVDTILETQFRGDESLRFASVCGLYALSHDDESEIGLSETELLRLANLEDEDFRRALAEEFGLAGPETGEESPAESLLDEIKRSVKDEFTDKDS